MKIKLDDQYMLTSDSYGWQIRKYAGIDKKSGKEKWDAISHHANIAQAVESHAGRLIRLSDATSFLEAENAVADVLRDLTAKLSPSIKVEVLEIE